MVSFVTVTPNKKIEVWLHLRVRKWETWLISSSRLALRLGPSLSPRSYFYISLLVLTYRLIVGVSEQMIWSYSAFFSCPGRIFSYCVRARAYTHVLARVYSTRASTCTIYTCFTLPPTRVNPTGLQLSIFQQFWSFVTNIRTSMLPNKFYGRAQPNWDNFDFDFDNCGSYFWKSWPCLICLQFIYLQTDHVMPPSLDFERE